MSIKHPKNGNPLKIGAPMMLFRGGDFKKTPQYLVFYGI